MKKISQKAFISLSHSASISHPMSPSKQFRSEITQLWTKEGADKIFRTEKDFVKWLNSPNPGLEGVAPIQFIRSDSKKIADLLGRILHGILA